MRYIIKPKKVIKLGDTRERVAFLFFPKRIGNEIRWLERARWEERYDEYYFFSGWKKKWKATKWLLNGWEVYN